MADTYVVTLDTGAWTDVSQGNTSGYITNDSDHFVYYTQSESLPSPDIKEGHKLQPGISVSFSLTLPEVIYMRSVQSNGKIILTPGSISTIS